MSEDDQDKSDPNPSDETPFGPDAGKSLVLRMFFEQVRKRLKESGVSENHVLTIRPADYATLFAGHTELKIGPAMEEVKKLIEAEGHQVVLILDEADTLNLDKTDDQGEARTR